jgi:hypothetical protein
MENTKPVFVLLTAVAVIAASVSNMIDAVAEIADHATVIIGLVREFDVLDPWHPWITNMVVVGIGVAVLIPTGGRPGPAEL